MEYQKDIIVANRLGMLPTDSEEKYLAHLLCLGGTCRYRFNERDFELHAGDLSIVRKRKMIEKQSSVGYSRPRCIVRADRQSYTCHPFGRRFSRLDVRHAKCRGERRCIL